jgi:TrkA domain protein
VGVCHTATTEAGQRLGIISHVSGRREIVLYDPDDPDRAARTVSLDPDEAQHIADLLNATVTIDHVTELERRVDGIAAVRIRVPLGSGCHGRPLRDVSVQSGTGFSVVAVIRGGRVTTAPGVDFVLRHDDVVVAVGDSRGVAVLTDILTAGEPLSGLTATR